MTLGAMIADFADEGCAMEALVATGDIALMARVQSAAGDAQLPVDELIGDLVGWFNSSATPDEWLHVLAVSNRSASPGEACLGAMLCVALKHRQTQRRQGPARPGDATLRLDARLKAERGNRPG